MIVQVSYDDSIPEDVRGFIESCASSLFPSNLKLSFLCGPEIGKRDYVERQIDFGINRPDISSYILDMTRKHKYKNKRLDFPCYKNPMNRVYGHSISENNRMPLDIQYSWISPSSQRKENSTRVFAHELAHYWIYGASRPLLHDGLGHCESVIDGKFCIMNITADNRDSADLVFCEGCYGILSL